MAADSIYRVTDLVGTSKVSWDDAVKNAVQTAAKSLRDLRVAEVTRLDVTIDKGKVTAYRARVNMSFKYEKDETVPASRAQAAVTTKPAARTTKPAAVATKPAAVTAKPRRPDRGAAASDK
jgi:flavin-binding protein dodecin